MAANKKIILASGSFARKSMLQSAGLDFKVIPADIDESALMKPGADTSQITERLAVAKAQYVAADYPEALVIGSDQTLEFEGRVLSKSPTVENGKEVLRMLGGKTHRLYSSVCVVAGGDDVLFKHTDYADLTMHDFDEEFLETYAARDADALVSCVGGYKIEGAGAWLFSDVKGDYYTIMGMPLLPLLAFLRVGCKILP